MARGVPVDPEIKKQAISEYLAGSKASDVASRHGIDSKLREQVLVDVFTFLNQIEILIRTRRLARIS